MAGKASQMAASSTLAERLLRVLEAQRSLGPSSYPLTARRLVELTDPQAPAALVKQALNKKAFLAGAVLLKAKVPDAPVALASDLNRLVGSPLTLEFLLRAAATPKTRAFSPAGLKKYAAGKLHKPFQEALGRHIGAGTLPPTVGWLLIGGRPHLFLLSDVHSGQRAEGATADTAEAQSPPSSSADFAAAFDAAFQRLNQQGGGHNFVRLVELRQALPLARAAFDAGLQQLRREGRYGLSAAEGRRGITLEERQAGLAEEGSLLLFVSRSTP